jgi:amino acid transporter
MMAWAATPTPAKSKARAQPSEADRDKFEELHHTQETMTTATATQPPKQRPSQTPGRKGGGGGGTDVALPSILTGYAAIVWEAIPEKVDDTRNFLNRYPLAYTLTLLCTFGAVAILLNVVLSQCCPRAPQARAIRRTK